MTDDEDPVRRIVRGREIPDRLIENLRRAPLVRETDIARFGHAAGFEGMMLSDREVQTLRALGDGGLNRAQTAEVLGCSLQTVNTHIKGATAKLGAKTTMQAVARAIRRDLI